MVHYWLSWFFFFRITVIAKTFPGLWRGTLKNQKICKYLTSFYGRLFPPQDLKKKEKKRCVHLCLAILSLWLFSQNSTFISCSFEFISHNYDFFSQKCKFLSCNFEFISHNYDFFSKNCKFFESISHNHYHFLRIAHLYLALLSLYLIIMTVFSE